MLFDVLRSRDPKEIIIFFGVRLFVVFCTLPVHEFAHAFAAHKLGDDTAKDAGRLTLNPLSHIDLIGALMIFFVGFGYASPVPVNPRNFKNKKSGSVITSLAGPASNLIMSLFFILLGDISVVLYSKGAVSYTLCYALNTFFCTAAYINISLAVFNLLPIPPLDGSALLTVFLPPKYLMKVYRYQRYIILGIFALLFLGVLSTPLAWLTGVIYNLFTKLIGLAFGL